MTSENLSLEWQVLQAQFDSYEKYSLAIKLIAIVFSGLLVCCSANPIFVAIVIGIFWLQDGIWKTYQSRFYTRLLNIEAAIVNKAATQGCQFNTEYERTAHSGVGLIVEYLKSMLRPTTLLLYVTLEATVAFYFFMVL